LHVPSAFAVTERVDDALVIDYEPTSLELEPGERGLIMFRVQNVMTCSTFVGMEFTFIDAPGHSTGTIEPSYFELGPQEEREVRVVVESHASYRQEIGYSDFVIDIYWGSGLTQEVDGEIDRDTRDGEWMREFPVRDDFSHQDATFRLIIMIILLIVVVAVVVSILRARSRRDVPPPS
jgi:hypothetical protein